MDHMTFLERRRIQMEYVVPLVKDLMAVLGEQTVLSALEEVNERRVANTSQGKQPDFSRMSAAADMFAEGDALEFDIISSTEESFAMDVRRCRYADMMEELGGRDIGHLLICAGDFPDAKKMGMRLERTQTCMQGGSHCDFRYSKAD